MLSLCELRRAAGILNDRLAGAKIQRVLQLDEYRLVCSLYGAGQTTTLLFSCRPGFARVSSLEEPPKAPDVPPPFVQYFRAHLSRSVLEEVRAGEDDRFLLVGLRGRNGFFKVILSILGSRSNLYLLDGSGRLVQAMRSLEQTRHELAFGREWSAPEGKVRSGGTDRWEGCSDYEYLAAVEETYAGLERAKDIEDLSRKIEQALARESSFLERKASNLAEDLGKAAHAQEQRRIGELLKGALHRISPGADQVTANDYETGEQVVIRLDSKLSPAENLAAYFHRYQRKQRATAAIRNQLKILGESQAEIESLQGELRTILMTDAPDLKALENLSRRPPIRKLLKRSTPVRKSGGPRLKTQSFRKGVPSRLMPRRYRTDQGLEIWVGRSDEGNDTLTTRLARGNDLFFHLEGYPGSHVVLRTEGRRDVSSESLLDACELAVHFSKLRGGDRVDVHFAPVKNVKKPKGAKPGLVYIARGKTIHLRHDPKRLQNILASRVED